MGQGRQFGRLCPVEVKADQLGDELRRDLGRDAQFLDGLHLPPDRRPGQFGGARLVALGLGQSPGVGRRDVQNDAQLLGPGGRERDRRDKGRPSGAGCRKGQPNLIERRLLLAGLVLGRLGGLFGARFGFLFHGLDVAEILLDVFRPVGQE